ncbi:hypothetical protein BDR26DRAFT_205070 [Obelidium mucronatum]|nr:hypothetical protein BDR26DRAFT_205070 [Obelidium mucronatum]
MRHQQSMLFQDMAEKMDNAEYMSAVGENDTFLNCFLFDNDAFRAYRESARQARASFGINDSHHAQIERAVPLVATAIRQSQHEGVQQRTAIMEGILDANEKLDSLSVEVRSNNAAIMRLDCHMAEVSQEQRLIRDEYLRVQALTTSSHASSFMAQAAASMNHAVALNQTAIFVGSMVDRTPEQTAEIFERVTPPSTVYPLAPTMAPLPTAPLPTAALRPTGSVLPNERSPAAPMAMAPPTAGAPTAGAPAAAAPAAAAPSAAAIDGDPNIYHFFKLTKGNEISQCFHEFETGICGKPSVISVEKEHGVKWRQWMEGGKRINRKTKVVAELQKELDAFVKENSKRGIDSFSMSLKERMKG